MVTFAFSVPLTRNSVAVPLNVSWPAAGVAVTFNVSVSAPRPPGLDFTIPASDVVLPTAGKFDACEIGASTTVALTLCFVAFDLALATAANPPTARTSRSSTEIRRYMDASFEKEPSNGLPADSNQIGPLEARVKNVPRKKTRRPEDRPAPFLCSVPVWPFGD